MEVVHSKIYIFGVKHVIDYIVPYFVDTKILPPINNFVFERVSISIVYIPIRCTRISLECQSSTELGTIVLINGAVSRHLFATIAYPTKLNYNAYANYTRGFVSHLYILRRVYYIRTIYCCFFFMRFSVYITLKPSVAEL